MDKKTKKTTAAAKAVEKFNRGEGDARSAPEFQALLKMLRGGRR